MRVKTICAAEIVDAAVTKAVRAIWAILEGRQLSTSEPPRNGVITVYILGFMSSEAQARLDTNIARAA